MNKFSWIGLGGLALVASMVGVACGNSTDDDDGTGSGGNGCTTPTTSKTDGSTACEPQCEANEHCSTSGVTCIDGCTSTANCGEGEYCDMTAATHDLEGTSTGLCRTPPVCTTTTTSTNDSGTGTTTTTVTGSVTSCISGAGTMSAPTSACTSLQNCVETSCDTQFKVALGDDWASGTVGGDCEAFYACDAANGCSDTAEQGCSSSLTASCTTALTNVTSCIESSCSSQESACEASLGGGVSITIDAGTTAPSSACTSLVACCRAITDSADQEECASIAGSNDSTACQDGLNMFEASNECP